MIKILKIEIFFFCLNCFYNVGYFCQNSFDSCPGEKKTHSFKYWPEFNIDEKVYRKWSNYFDAIKHAHLYNAQSNFSMASINNISCSIYLPLLDSDLRYFENMFGPNFLTEEMIEKIASSRRGIHYQIIDHRLYRQNECMFPYRCKGIEHFLLKIINNLPNMDFFINVRDYPQVGNYFLKDQQWPIFSFSKDYKNYADIIYPAWTFWSGGPALDLYPQGIGRWDLMRDLLLKKQNLLPWSKKKDLFFFRGSRTSSLRDPLVLLSRSRPDLVDARYTKNQAWKSNKDTLGEEPAKTISLEDHCHYKYLFNAHGVAASFRFKHLFLCRSLVLNVESNWIEFFYPPLKPWIHYAPVDSNFTNIVDLLEFLKANQQLTSRIARKGFEFVRDHLKMNDVVCYWHNLLLHYSTRLVSYRPTRPNLNFIEIN